MIETNGNKNVLSFGRLNYFKFLWKFIEIFLLKKYIIYF